MNLEHKILQALVLLLSTIFSGVWANILSTKMRIRVNSLSKFHGSSLGKVRSWERRSLFVVGVTWYRSLILKVIVVFVLGQTISISTSLSHPCFPDPRHCCDKQCYLTFLKVPLLKTYLSCVLTSQRTGTN